jgi:hypothetical protein
MQRSMEQSGNKFRQRSGRPSAKVSENALQLSQRS